MQGRQVKTLGRPANLPILQHRWAQSVFHWYDHLASIFIPSGGLEDVIWHIETLTKYTQKALNDTAQGISLLNFEVQMMRKAIIQNRMALDILTAAQGGTCAIIKVECCVYIPDNSANVSYALQDLQKQILTMSDSTIPSAEQLWRWISKSSWWKGAISVMILIVILLIFGPCLLNCCFNLISSRLQSVHTQMILQRFNSIYMGPLDHPSRPERLQAWEL